MKIEKHIHYCWFGGNPKSEIINKCIESWRKMLPDYEITEWNETNFDINMSEYTKEAYKHKKYAFVSDFARFYVLNKYGGIYLDTDVEVKKSLDKFLDHECFMGFESKRYVAPGLIIGTVKNHPVIKDMYENYKKRKFYYSEDVLNQTTVVEVMTKYLVKNGLKRNNEKQNVCGVEIYPKTYFSPISYDSDVNDFSENTHTVHLFAGSWMPEKQKKVNKSKLFKFKKRIKEIIKGIIISLWGEDSFYKIKVKLKG